MFRRMYEWVMRLAGSRHAPASLAVISFAESSFFPIPPDVMLGPMVLARRDKAFIYAGICTIASVFGGMLGYAIGVFLEPVGQAILRIFGHPEGEAEFKRWFDQWGLAVILIKGLTPVPYKLVTIASGLAAFSFPVFCDAVTWRSLGLSMAGWNGLISIALAVFSLLAAKRPKDARAPRP